MHKYRLSQSKKVEILAPEVSQNGIKNWYKMVKFKTWQMCDYGVLKSQTNQINQPSIDQKFRVWLFEIKGRYIR